MSSTHEIILGIDPGTRVTGFGIVEKTKNMLVPLDYGCIRPPQKSVLSDRYLIIFEAIQTLIDKYRPNQIAIETQFMQKNAQSAIKLGIAMGSALIAAKQKQLSVFGYSPRVVKCAVCGTGKASKDQIELMIMRHLELKKPPKPQDASDALAIAICHIFYPQSSFDAKNKEL